MMPVTAARRASAGPVLVRLIAILAGVGATVLAAPPTLFGAQLPAFAVVAGAASGAVGLFPRTRWVGTFLLGVIGLWLVATIGVRGRRRTWSGSAGWPRASTSPTPRPRSPRCCRTTPWCRARCCAGGPVGSPPCWWSGWASGSAGWRWSGCLTDDPGRRSGRSSGRSSPRLLAGVTRLAAAPPFVALVRPALSRCRQNRRELRDSDARERRAAGWPGVALWS